MDVVGETKGAMNDPAAEPSSKPDLPDHVTVPDAGSDHRNHRVPGQYTYEQLGIEMIGFAPADFIDNEVRNMELREDDIVIAAYPKTGNTWMQEILWLIMNEADTDFANRTPIKDRVPFIEYCKYGFSGVAQLDNIGREKKNRIMDTHLPFELVPKQVREKKVKVVSMQRNPLDTMVSYYHFCRSYSDLGHFKGDWDDFFHLYTNEKVPYGHVINHNLSWWNARDDLNILFVRFEDLLNDPEQEIHKIAGFCGVTLTEESQGKIVAATRFGVMKDNPMVNREHYQPIDSTISHFMRKGIAGDWRNYFSIEQKELSNKIANMKLKETRLSYPGME